MQTRVLLSKNFVSQEKNGISRDTASMVAALEDNGNFELRISKKTSRRISKFYRVLFTLAFNNPIIYQNRHMASLIPQIENRLPKQKSSAVIRMHDVFPITNPEWFRFFPALAFGITLRRAVRDNHFFLCNSNSTQSALGKLYPSANSKVLYCKVDRAESKPCQTCQFCKNKELYEFPYFLSVGTIEPRKNYPLLVEAWLAVESKKSEKLIIVGKRGWKSKKIYSFLAKKRGSLIYLENLCNFGVISLTKKAFAFVSPSLDEGFNFPAMDAALAGIPLLLSDIPVHREFYNGCAYFFDPNKISELQSAFNANFRTIPKVPQDFLQSQERFEEKLRQYIYQISARNMC